MYIKEENGYFNDGHETPAFLIWKGEVGGELVAGPIKEAEADKMIAELQPVKKEPKAKKDVVKKTPAKKAPVKKTTKIKKSKQEITMPGKKTMKQAKKLGMKGSGYKSGKKVEKVKMNMGMKVPSMGMQVPTYNDVVRRKTGGKVQ